MRFLTKFVFSIGLILVIAACGNYILGKTDFWNCKKPITYSIGSFDQRFGLSKQELINALAQAEKSWEDVADKDLFKYVPEGGEVPVNLIYDYRQETTNILDQLESQVEVSEANYKILKSKYESLKSEYDALEVRYTSDAAAYNQSSATYEAHVNDWNHGPRTSQSQFNSLEQERKNLEASLGRIRQEEAVLNSKAEELNSLALSLNHLAESLNLNVRRYNTIGQERGETFTGGLYLSEGGREEIDIYEFSSQAKLLAVLAHELGHALGLDHVNDANAIMYEFNNGSTKPSSEDIKALKTLCRLE